MRAAALLCLVFLAPACFSQTDSLAVTDTIATAGDTVHSVKKAVIFSAIVPGAGQIYNHIAMPKGKKKAFWKVPLIYGGLGATGYYFIQNQQSMKSLRNEYESRIGGAAPSSYEEYDDSGLLTLYVAKRSTRDLCILGFAVVYLLNVADAGVEAHFVNFDISEDLSLNVSPVLMSMTTPGISLRLNFHTNRP